MTDKQSPTGSGMNIPDYAIESIARCLLPKIQKFYESKEGKRVFAEWKAKREKDKGQKSDI